MIEFFFWAVAWYMTGVSAAIWSTKKDLYDGEDFKADDLLCCIGMSILGPFLVWLVVHHHWKKDGAPILIKGRNQNERGRND